MSVVLNRENPYSHFSKTGLAKNSLALTDAAFVFVAGGIVDVAVAGGRIDGVSATVKTFASDNQTVAKDTVEYTDVSSQALYTVTITGGTITAADEGKYYDLSDSVTVDGTSESTTTGQLRMVKFVSATSAIFQIVNA
jgi:hypothetical protein